MLALATQDSQALRAAGVRLHYFYRRLQLLVLPVNWCSVLNGLVVRLEDRAMVQSLIVDLFMLVFALEGLLPLNLLSNVPVFIATVVHHRCRHFFVQCDGERDRIRCR